MIPARHILAASLAGTLAALPLAANAEGARIVFTCTGKGGREATFTIAPVSLDATGKGKIEVTTDGQTYPGVAASDRGPFQWGTDTDHFALLVEGQAADGQLKVRLHHATATSSTLTPYTCEAAP